MNWFKASSSQVVHAVQYNGGNLSELCSLTSQDLKSNGVNQPVLINTPDGEVSLAVGQWAILDTSSDQHFVYCLPPETFKLIFYPLCVDLPEKKK